MEGEKVVSPKHKEFDPEDFEYLMTRWGKKIRFCSEGDMRWGLFLAYK